MSALLDEASVALQDESGGMLLDEEASVELHVTSSFYAHTAVSAQVTMEFEAGQPVQFGLTTLASDPWVSTYPG